MAKRKHLLVVEIDCLDPQSPRAAADRLRRWMEHEGHTSPSHGFELVNVYSSLNKAMSHDE